MKNNYALISGKPSDYRLVPGHAEQYRLLPSSSSRFDLIPSEETHYTLVQGDMRPLAYIGQNSFLPTLRHFFGLAQKREQFSQGN